MKVTRPLSIAMLCATLSLTVSCSHKPEDSKDMAENMNDEKFEGKAEKNAEKLVDAYSSNLFEVRVSENASLNATTPEVKNLAMMLVEKHNQMNQEVQALATKKQVSLPTDLTDDQKNDIEKLAQKRGVEYDKAYTEKMKEKHEDAIRTYEKIADKCDDPEIRDWAAKNVTEVRSHLDMVVSAHNTVKDVH